MLLAAILASAGCGGEEPQSQDGGTATTEAPTDEMPAQADVTEQDIIDALGLTADDEGISYESAEGCQVAVVLDSPEEVAVYRDAGDTVATNAAGTVGVKIVGDDSGDCFGALSEKMTGVGEP